MSNKFKSTEELMEHLKKQIVQYSNGEEVALDYSSNQELPTMAGQIDIARLKQEVERNNLLWNVSADQPITSHRKVSGKLIVFGKKFVRKFLRWYVATPFKSQTEFNGSITRSFNETTNLLLIAKTKIEELTSSQHELMNRINLMEERLSRQDNIIGKYENETHTKFEHLKSDLDRLTDNEEVFHNIGQRINVVQEDIKLIDKLTNEQKNTMNNFIFPKLDEMNGRIHFNEQQLRAELNFLNYRIRKSKNTHLKIADATSLHVNIDKDKTESATEESQFDYLLFENRFRGSNEDIRNRQMKYLPYFESKQNVLDIGCGRGEFIELLLNSNISAKGIDMTDEMVEYCQDLGLPVVKQDAINYLEQQEDNSIGGIFLGQVIEHIPFDSIIKLVELAWNKLMPGCYLIMETPNPQTLAIFNRSFYMDPTHVKPVHPLTVQFLTESVGFRESKVIYSGRVEKESALPHVQASLDSIQNIEEINNSIDRLNDLLFGDQDYALIARK
ncbi:class I SAM-dependent methyltransferase [Paenibacillus sp. FSL F4-0243]|uniref:class I SAM-dependent methyltransferase n=1 Tax=Paenibacillus sp. FSL F4-0243 TaxID=2954732 RepID=UPI0030DABB33